MIETSTLLQSYPAAAAGTALLAGIASSVSPCTVAAVPLVVGYVGGYADGSRRLALLYAGAFVLGLSLVFTGLGLAVALAGALFLPAGGVWQLVLLTLTLVAGLSLVSGRSLPGLANRQCGQATSIRWQGVLGALAAGALSGVVFAPCATPVMVGILALIGNQRDVLFGTLLMFLYSIGHGAPLLAAGASLGFAQWLARARWSGIVNRLFSRLAGALLIGYALYFGFGLASSS